MRLKSIAIVRIGSVVAALAVTLAGLAKVRILGYWWENPVPHQDPPRGLTSLSAAQCGTCHQEIYAEWKASIHAQALRDKQFQAEMAKAPDAAWLCLNCHTPLENQLAQIAVGVKAGSTLQPILRKNARFDAALNQEAITCAVCHVRDGVVLGPWGDSQAPHPVRRDPKLLDEQNCASCHQATAAYSDILVCTFDTAKEWRASPYAAQGRACTHCHMPEVRRSVAVGGPERNSRRHLFLGSKIPKEKTLPEAERRFYDLYSSGLNVEIVGNRPHWKLVLKNARAGHMLPTGDPERFILVKAELVNASGTVIDHRIHRIGQEWVWNPKARKISDNRLKPLEEREISLPFQNAARGGTIRVTVENWRISEQNAAYHKLTGAYPLSAVVLQVRREVGSR